MRDLKNLCLLGVLLWTCISFLPPCEYDKDNVWKIQPTLHLVDRDELTDTLFGIDLVVDSKDRLISQWIKDGGSFNAKSARTILRFVKKGDRVMNVGSHVAMESMVIGKIIGPTGRLYIFQPYSVSYGIALKNVYLSELENITTLFNAGCAQTKIIGNIVVSFTNTGASQVFINGEEKPTTEKVYLDKLDNMVEGPIDFMLMDVERLEIDCLIGMKKIIKESPNIIMYIEWGITNLIQNPKEKEKAILTWLYEEGFKFYVYNEKATGNCDPVVFQEKSVDEILNYPFRADQWYLVDITMARAHIDPNNLF